MKSAFFGIIFLLFIVYSVLGQTSEFGDIDYDEFTMTVYELDSSTNAVVLFDVGETEIVYDSGQRKFDVYLRRHKRIKIFNENGFDYANVEIPYYKSKGNKIKEKVKKLNASTFYLDNQGVPQEMKVDKDEIFDEEVNEYYRKKILTFPGVVQGAIIEYEYEIKTDYIYNINPWFFQDDIPVQWSEFTFMFPYHLNYTIVTNNYFPFDLESVEIEQNRFAIRHSWGLRNIPAYRPEDYSNPRHDNITKIEFQLKSISKSEVADTWKNIGISLFEDEGFSFNTTRLESQLLEDSILQKINIKELNNGKKIETIFNFLKSTYDWNKKNGLYPDKNLRKLLKEKTGNATSINLLLTALLNSSNIEAYPLLISTREHGKINYLLKSLSAFDYVACCVLLENDTIYLDATEDYSGINELPYRCLNQIGRVLTDEGGFWVDITPKNGFKNSLNFVLNLDTEKNQLEGDFRLTLSGLTASEAREDFLSEVEDDYFEEQKEFFNEESDFESVEIQNLEDFNEPLIINGKYILEQEQLGNLYYLDAFHHKIFDENPFKQEERHYPVNLGAPISENYSMSIILPENIVIEEIPESVSLLLPNNEGKFKMITGQVGNQVQISSKFEINQVYFQPEEYASLREFVTQVLKQQDSKIVLKLIEE